MKRSFLLLLILMPGYFYPVTAQITFQRIYNITSSEALTGPIHQTPDGGYITTMKNLTKLDAYGNISWIKTYPFLPYCVSPFVNNGYAIGGEYLISMFPSKAVVARTDSLGDTLWCNYYNSSNDFSFGYQSLVMKDSNYLFAIFDDNQGLNDFSYFLKLDTSGNYLWDSDDGESAFATILSDGSWASWDYGDYTYVTSIRKHDDSTGIMCTTGYYDSTFSSIMEPHDMIEGWDTSLILVGGKDGNAWLGKINAITCDTIFSNEYFTDGYYNGITRTFDGGYALIGYERADSMWHLFKMNSNMDTVWSKKYSWPGGYTSLHRIEQTADSGFILRGYAYTFSGDHWLYLIKTDSLGNTSPLSTNIDSYSSSLQISIYPNPAHSNLNISLVNSIPAKTHLSVMNSIGEIMFEKNLIRYETSIDVSFFPAGIYFLKIQTEENFVYQKFIKD